MNAAVIDRIRAYADDGMSPERIASTLDVPEADVRRHLVGVMAPTNGVKSNVESPPMSPASVDEHRSDIGPEKKNKTPPPPVPIRGDGRPTDKQRAIWALVVDGGLTRTEAAERLGILAPSVRNQLIAYMQHMGIEGPIPGRSERTGPKQRAIEASAPAPAVPSTPAPVTQLHHPAPDVLVDLPSDSHATPAEQVAGELADALPEPPTTIGPDRNTPDTHVLSASDADLRARYVGSLLAALAGSTAPGQIRDRIERALGIDAATPLDTDDRDLWADGYRHALGQMLDAIRQTDSASWRFALTERIARMAIDVPRA